MSTYFAYIRVSTVRQGEHGVSLDEQRAAISKYAKRHNLDVSQWFEEHVTAAKSGRPVFNRMLKLLKDGQAQGLVVHAIDRGVRNLWDWASLGELLDEGIDVRFVREDVDMAGRGGRLAADIQAVVAADYVRNLKEETLKGFYGRLKKGYYPLKSPVGYIDNGSGKLKTICPVKGPLVRKAFELYATGTFTLGMLSGELYLLGLRNGRGTRFSDNGMSAILNNPFYMGLIRIRKTKETFPGAHEPLVSKSLFDRVQNVLHGRTQKRVRKHDFLYRGVLRCPECIRYLAGERQRGRVYYRCHQKHETPICYSEDQVIESIKHVVATLTRADIEALSQADHFQHDQAGEKDHAVLRKQLDEVTQRLRRLDEVYHEGSIDAALYRSRKQAYLLEKLGLEERLTRAAKQETRRASTRKTLLERAKNFTGLSNPEKRELARILFSTHPVNGTPESSSKPVRVNSAPVSPNAA